MSSITFWKKPSTPRRVSRLSAQPESTQLTASSSDPSMEDEGANFERSSEPLDFPDFGQSRGVGELSAVEAQRHFSERKLGSAVGAATSLPYAEAKRARGVSMAHVPFEGVQQEQKQTEQAPPMQMQSVPDVSQAIAQASQAVQQAQQVVQQIQSSQEHLIEAQPSAIGQSSHAVQGEGVQQGSHAVQGEGVQQNQAYRYIPHSSFTMKGNKGIAQYSRPNGASVVIEKEGDIFTYSSDGRTFRIYPYARRAQLMKGLRLGLASKGQDPKVHYDRWGIPVLWDMEDYKKASERYELIRNSYNAVTNSSGEAQTESNVLGFDPTKPFSAYTPKEQEAYIAHDLQANGYRGKELNDFVYGSYEGTFEPDRIIEETKGRPLAERLTALSEHGTKTGHEVPMSYYQKLLGDTEFIDETPVQREKREKRERRMRLIGGIADVFANLFNVVRTGQGHMAYKVDQSALRYLDERYESHRKAAVAKRDALLAKLLADGKLVGDDKRQARKLYATWQKSAQDRERYLRDMFLKYGLAQHKSDSSLSLEHLKQAGMNMRKDNELETRKLIAQWDNATRRAVAITNANASVASARIKGANGSGGDHFRFKNANGEWVYVNPKHLGSVSAAADASGLKSPFELKGSGPTAALKPGKLAGSTGTMAAHLAANLLKEGFELEYIPHSGSDEQ